MNFKHCETGGLRFPTIPYSSKRSSSSSYIPHHLFMENLYCGITFLACVWYNGPIAPYPWCYKRIQKKDSEKLKMDLKIELKETSMEGHKLHQPSKL